MTEIKFTKMQAYGNDYVYINTFTQPVENPNELAKELSNRRFGIGSDGLVLICPSETCDFRMRMFNPDGTEGEMCGNALRSVSKYVYDRKMTDKTRFCVETLGGIQHITIEKGEDHTAKNITADIGYPVFDTKKIPVAVESGEFVNQKVHIIDRDFYMSSLSWGNPHTVMFINDDLSEFDVEKYGRAIENDTDLFPRKTNVTFAVIVDRNNISIREWERGTGETIGCGTGCCTAAVFANRAGMCDRNISVKQIGGTLTVNIAQDGRTSMTGPSNIMFDGVYYKK